MRIDVLTLFPEMFECLISTSIIKRAILNKKVTINLVNIRDYSEYNNNQVDDTPFGGGNGMVLMCDPVFKALESVKTDESYTIIMTPRGNIYKQGTAKKYKEIKHLIIICGHYEGFDERIYNLVDEEISIGDFILTGGEIPAMSVIDSVVRLIPGVITEGSLESESFENNLLDYPVYTKPRIYNGMEVPEVLLSGNHAKIKEYREKERLRITKEKRPDLLER
mgnify:CR=1 FL=1